MAISGHQRQSSGDPGPTVAIGVPNRGQSAASGAHHATASAIASFGAKDAKTTRVVLSMSSSDALDDEERRRWAWASASARDGH